MEAFTEGVLLMVMPTFSVWGPSLCGFSSRLMGVSFLVAEVAERSGLLGGRGGGPPLAERGLLVAAGLSVRVAGVLALAVPVLLVVVVTDRAGGKGFLAC